MIIQQKEDAEKEENKSQIDGDGEGSKEGVDMQQGDQEQVRQMQIFVYFFLKKRNY